MACDSFVILNTVESGAVSALALELGVKFGVSIRLGARSRLLEGGVLKTYRNGLSSTCIGWLSFRSVGAADGPAFCSDPLRKGFDRFGLRQCLVRGNPAGSCLPTECGEPLQELSRYCFVVQFLRLHLFHTGFFIRVWPFL